ncbi:hypothetical protein [Ruminobacter sp.]|uniref:hypothetical protein n=1 Tax=Ruminobacter sp. TaxID=2774296 RepID=UPI00386ACF0D
MKELKLTEQELLNISVFIEDVASWGEDGATGGMYAGNAYISPSVCYNVAKVLKKINEHYFDNPTVYKRAYNKLMKFAENK